MSKEKTIIFTDLDGTLLDHNNYSFKDVLPMLDFLFSNRIPLIIVTSKTETEVIRIQKLLKINEPFIIENGAGIIIPRNEGYEIISMGFDYAHIRSCFLKYAQSIPIRGFFDMKDEEMAEISICV